MSLDRRGWIFAGVLYLSLSAGLSWIAALECGAWDVTLKIA